MRYAVTFLLLGACFVAVAVRTGGWGYLFLWPGLSATLVGLGYAGLGSRVFGKRRDGGYALWARLVHGPYMWITLGVWQLFFVRPNRLTCRSSPQVNAYGCAVTSASRAS